MICVESWAGDHFGVDLTQQIDPRLTKICALCEKLLCEMIGYYDMRKTIFTFSFPVTLTFNLQSTNLPR